MRAFNRIFVGITIIMMGLFVTVNYIMFQWYSGDVKIREYRVEINRLAGEITRGGIAETDLSKCRYVTAVVKDTGKEEFFLPGDSDYLIQEIEGALYRFEYRTQEKALNKSVILLMDSAFLLLFILMSGLMIFLKYRILQPFFTLRELPYELSKGNLTMPVKENRNRFFGRFVWGMDLLRENLEQQKQRELELQKEKKTLVLSVSHDIKTPLSAIKLYAKALSKGLYKEEAKQLAIAESINQKADEIEKYVSDIIKAENEEFLNLPVKMEEFYLSELLSHIREFYEDKLEYLKTEFRMEEYCDCLLKGDAERSVEVLQNLMENAIKYGDGRSIQIENEQEEDCLLITVKSSGGELKAEEAAHIFDAFWRGSNAEHAPGSGLGLYICKELMHKMDGEIFAKAEAGGMSVTAVFRMA